MLPRPLISNARPPTPAAPRGFTLIEILIVVVMLGILAALAIPQFSNATTEARENMLAENLRVIKAQIGTYRAQHWDMPPGYPDGDVAAAPTEQAFVSQLTRFTDEQGAVSDARSDRFKYGPYMREIPKDPINGQNAVQVLGPGEAIPDGDDSHGWIFSPGDMFLAADAAGTDSKGKKYSDY